MNKLRNLVFIFLWLSLLIANATAQDLVSSKINYDAKIYKILLKELKAAEKLAKAEPGTNNLFRVFTTRVEILKFLKTKNVEDTLRNPNAPHVKTEARQIQQFYARTQTIAETLDSDKGFKERAKFLLLYGLMLYDFDEKNKNVPQILGTAFVQIKETELKHMAASKLGDYYFNLPNFKESAKYYREALKLDPKSEWRTRHLYNLGWCYFKMENFDTSIKLLLSIFNSAQTAEEKKDYYFQQSIQKIPFFYLYDNNPEEGYRFVKKNNGVASNEMTNYIKEIYNKGFFDKLDPLVIDIENTLESSKSYQALLNFQLDIYFHIASREFKKNYSMLSRLRKGIADGDARKLLNSEKKAHFIDDNKGLLNQHLIIVNRKTFDANRNLDDKLALEDSVDILRLLLSMDASNSVNYRLKLAQLYNKTGQRDQAMKMLWEDYIKYGGVTNPEAGPYLAELLAVIDAMGEKAPTENIEKIYQDYLKVGKDQSIRKVVYLKYFDFVFNRGDFKVAMSLIKRHQKEFPNEKDDRRNMIVKVTNNALKQKDKALFEMVREHAKKDPAVNTDPQLMRTINTGHNTFLLERVNKSLNEEGSDKGSAAAKLAEIFRSNSIDRSNQLISGFNAGLIFLNLGNLSNSGQIYSEFVEQLSPAEYNTYHDKLSVIADNQLLLGNEDYSLQLYQKLINASCKQNKTVNVNDVLKSFELLMLKNNDSTVLDFLSTADKCQWSADLRKKVFTLIIEYMNWSDPNEGKKNLKYLALQKVNKKEEIEKVVESIFVHSFNKKQDVSIADVSQVMDSVEKNWLTSISYSSEFTNELRNLLMRNSKLRPYPKERINAANFAKFVTRAFDFFTANLDLFTTYRPKYPVVFHVKSMLEIATIENFIASFKDVSTLVDDEKNKALYVDQIKEALKPIEDRVVAEKGKLSSFMQSEGTLLKHRSLIQNTQLYPAINTPFILDRL